MSSSAIPGQPRATGALVTFAANNGEVGGGEVMLLAFARAAREAGYAVDIVGPSAPDGVLAAAADLGFTVAGLAPDRRTYLHELWRWSRGRPGILWCNGLVPSLATLGHSRRVVHLHRLPRGAQRSAAQLARLGALATVVPSQFMADHFAGATVLENWTTSHAVTAPQPVLNPAVSQVLRLGYLGRWAHEKGIDVLLHAATELSAHWSGAPGSSAPTLEVVLAGSPRFSTADEAAELRAAVQATPVRVRELGWVPPEVLLDDIDVLVVPSRAPESFGLVAAEAMARRIPVVATDAGALTEVLGPDYPWIARPDNVSSLTQALLACASAGAAERTRVVDLGRTRWEQRYSPHAGATRFVTLLDTLSAHAGAR